MQDPWLTRVRRKANPNESESKVEVARKSADACYFFIHPLEGARAITSAGDRAGRRKLCSYSVQSL
jgi:hypothetical protein